MSTKKRNISGKFLLFTAIVAQYSSLTAQSVDHGNVHTFYNFQGLNPTAFVQPGDINIGVLLEVYGSPPGMRFHCDQMKLSMKTLQNIEAVSFAVELINKNSALLPNITFGFVILDECDSENTALAQSLSFLPRNSEFCSQHFCTNLTSLSSPTLPASLSQDQTSGHYDVMGIVGPGRSDRCVPMSLLYSIARIPIISARASSDFLSDKIKYRYFLRLIPPDIYQVEAMLSFVKKHNWSYISVLYHAGSYGDPAYENMKKMAPGLGICIASSHRVSPNSDLRPVAQGLLEVKRARVVILFTNIAVVTKLMHELQQHRMLGHFVFLGSDAWASSTAALTPYANEIAGAFVFSPFAAIVHDFREYFRSLRPQTSPNPWMRWAWETFTDCSLTNNTCNVQKGLPDLIDGFVFHDDSSNIIDAVLTYAHAAHNLVSDLCPTAMGPNATACVKPDRLLNYLLNVSFEGFSGSVQFSDEGDLKGKYEIQQFVPDTISPEQRITRVVAKSVAFYSVNTSSVEYYSDSSVMWDLFNNIERLVPLLPGEDPQIPESVCSRPCLVGEYKIQKKLECCWDCRRCRDNERVLHHRPSDPCQPCPIFTWPDPLTNLTTCLDIPAHYVSSSDSLSIILICLGVTAMCGAVLTFFAYIYLRDMRVIKAASRELSLLQLLAIFAGYGTVVCFQSKPTPVTCGVLYFLFCLSFTWLYAPLLIKAVRIFRIFHNGAKQNQRPRFTSPLSQLLMSSVLITFQVLICIAVTVLYHPSSQLSQPVLIEKYVELSCDMTLPGIVSFLAYNLVLVSFCSVFAFKTRKLPDNFNESRFMSMCVSSTLVIWLAFIPTYLTASREYVRVLLLSAALLLNHTVALVFLFLPKIYAGVYLPDENMTGMISQMPPNSLASRRTGVQFSNNRVAPNTSNGPQPQEQRAAD